MASAQDCGAFSKCVVHTVGLRTQCIADAVKLPGGLQETIDAEVVAKMGKLPSIS